MSERGERMSKQRSKWPSTLRVDFVVIQPTVEWQSGGGDRMSVGLIKTRGWTISGNAKSVETIGAGIIPHKPISKRVSVQGG